MRNLIILLALTVAGCGNYDDCKDCQTPKQEVVAVNNPDSGVVVNVTVIVNNSANANSNSSSSSDASSSSSSSSSSQTGCATCTVDAGTDAGTTCTNVCTKHRQIYKCCDGTFADFEWQTNGKDCELIDDPLVCKEWSCQ